MLFAGVGATPPVGWFLCDGQAVNRIAFAALFAAIGTLYGVGDGSTTFNVPKFDDNRKARGAVNDAARGTTGGVNSVTLTAAQSGLPAHNHQERHFTLGVGSGLGINDPRDNTPSSTNDPLTENAGPDAASASHSNESLFVDVNYIIHV